MKFCGSLPICLNMVGGLSMLKRKKTVRELKWISFVIPALFFYILFFWVPSLESVYYSFTKWDGVTSEFVGIKNYIRLFHDRQILESIGNTVFYTVTIVIIQNILGFVFAVLLERSCLKNNILRTLIFMPYVFSSLLIGYVFKFMLESNIGALNNILRNLNLEGIILPWLSNPSVSRWVITAVTVWQCVGYTMVINIAGLQSIPDMYYEAASLDGATKMQKLIHITFPLIAPATTINVMLSLIGNLQIYNQVYTLTGGPAHKTESIAVTLYRLGFSSEGAQWGYGAAIAVAMFVIILIITVITTTMLRKREVEA